MKNSTNLILEALFTGADEEEQLQRTADAPKIMFKEWMDEFLKRKDIKKNADGSYDVDGDVTLMALVGDLGLGELPISFGKVTGSFECSHNYMSTLKGCPKEVGMDFRCQFNYLTSLKGCPKTIKGVFDCSYNSLDDLKNGPTYVGKSFWCANNGEEFTEEYVRSLIDVKGAVYVD